MRVARSLRYACEWYVLQGWAACGMASCRVRRASTSPSLLGQTSWLLFSRSWRPRCAWVCLEVSRLPRVARVRGAVCVSRLIPAVGVDHGRAPHRLCVLYAYRVHAHCRRPRAYRLSRSRRPSVYSARACCPGTAATVRAVGRCSQTRAVFVPISGTLTEAPPRPGWPVSSSSASSDGVQTPSTSFFVTPASGSARTSRHWRLRAVGCRLVGVGRPAVR